MQEKLVFILISGPRKMPSLIRLCYCYCAEDITQSTVQACADQKCKQIIFHLPTVTC